jgi:hypothetical protein
MFELLSKNIPLIVLGLYVLNMLLPGSAQHWCIAFPWLFGPLTENGACRCLNSPEVFPVTHAQPLTRQSGVERKSINKQFSCKQQKGHASMHMGQCLGYHAFL